MIKNVNTGYRTIGLTQLFSTENTSLKLSDTSIDLFLDQQYQLTIKSDYEEMPVWESSNESVVKVDQLGLVTAVGEGNATITVTSNKLVGKCYVKVILTDNQKFDKDLNNGKVVLKKSITKTAIATNKTSINLNGKTITGELFAESGGQMLEGSTDSYAIWVKDGGDVTIEGKGTVESQSAKCSIAVWAQGGTITIKDGKYYNNGNGSDLIYASAGGKVYIHGGEFHANETQPYEPGTANKYSALNIKDSDRDESRIVVYGGTFYGFNPADNLSEGPGTNFVAEGYESVQIENDVWRVQPKPEPQLDNTKIYYGTIQSSEFTSYSNITKSDILKAVESGTIFTEPLHEAELLITVENKGDSVIVLIPSDKYRAYKNNGSGSKVKFDETVSLEENNEANGELKLEDFYIFGEVIFTTTGNLTIYVE